RARLELINSPITGPVISGRHQSPFVCKTEELGLGSALDADCSAKTKIVYFYKSTEPAPPPTSAGMRGFKELDPAASSRSGEGHHYRGHDRELHCPPRSGDD